MTEPRPTTLYRHFDADGRLLYVGISKSAINRLQAHESNSGWAAAIARVTVERFATRQEAADAERRAIEAERPTHNTLHNKHAAPVKTQLNRVDVGARFREARVRAGLTQQDIAERCELTYQAVQNYEAGRNTPTVRTLALFCKATDTSADWLLFGDE